MKIVLLFLLQLFAQGSLAQEEEPFFDTLIAPTKEVLKKQNLNKAEAQKYVMTKEELKKIGKSPTVYLYLKKGMAIFDTKTRQFKKLPKDIYTQAHTLPDQWNDLYLADKDHILRYKIHGANLLSLQEDLDMTTGPTTFIERYRPVVIKEDPIKKSYQVALYLDQYQASGTADKTGDQARGIGKRFELSHYFQTTSFPLSWGLVGQYEDTKIGTSTQKKSWGLGISLKTKPSETTPIPLSYGLMGIFGEAKASTQNADVEVGQFTAQQISLQPFVETKVKSPIGNFILGLNYRQQWLRTSYQQSSTNRIVDQSYGVYIGINWN